jgi:hypothetical protein
MGKDQGYEYAVTSIRFIKDAHSWTTQDLNIQPSGEGWEHVCTDVVSDTINHILFWTWKRRVKEYSSKADLLILLSRARYLINEIHIDNNDSNYDRKSNGLRIEKECLNREIRKALTKYNEKTYEEEEDE